MKTLNKVASNPSGLDSYSNYAGEIPSDSLLVVLTRSRDSDILSESNWEVALERLGGESDTVEIHRFGHWACGWWEALCVQAGSQQQEEAGEIESDLEAYRSCRKIIFQKRNPMKRSGFGRSVTPQRNGLNISERVRASTSGALGTYCNASGGYSPLVGMMGIAD